MWCQLTVDPGQARITLEMALDEIRSILSHDHDPILGDFVWTGMDYIGESALGAAVLARRKIRLDRQPPRPLEQMQRPQSR